MSDWRQIERKSQSRQKDRTGLSSGGIFMGLIQSSSSENQTAQLTYPGGASNMDLPMPFESVTSWIRSIPVSGSPALLTYRRDSNAITFLRYINESAKNNLAAYRQGANLYRPLAPGEHEVHSSGHAQSYYSQRPVLEQRGGVIRSWLDQDKAECGQKSPLHTRQLYEHRSNTVGDEERFGVVRRPKKLNTANAALLGETHSSNFYDYPIPDFSLPGGVPNAFSALAAATAAASEAAAALTGTFKIRPFAKEYLKKIKNPLYKFGVPPEYLIDIREGQVFDDDGEQVVGEQGAYLRAKYEYFTTSATSDPTKLEIDELGNVNWTLAFVADGGWVTRIPGIGIWRLDVGTGGIDISTLGSTVMSSTQDTSIASANMSLSSNVDMSFETGVNFTHAIQGTCDTQAKMAMTYKTDTNFVVKAGAVFDAKADSQMNLNSPVVQIGNSPNEAAALGNKLATWLTDLCNTFVQNQTNIGIGNTGAPVPLNPTVVSAIQKLSGQIQSLLSTSITLTP